MSLFKKDTQLPKTKEHIKKVNSKFSFIGMKAALKAVPSFLDNDEKFIYATTGDFKGVCLVLVTNKRVLVLQKDPLGGDEHVLNISLDKISDISYKEGMVFSNLFITDSEQIHKIKQISSNDIENLVKSIKETMTSSAHKVLKEGLYCPYCNSENVKPLGADRKAFSVGKAAAGAVLTGGIGVLAGFAGKKSGKTDFVCMNCGKQFKK